ncbi:hypothetical protein [Sphingomicrobium arenosum]|uniref:hypothetical protein n=1 Tax=Sphingomicrobium arenosum TaxID=2233861 RepID=UPI002240D1F4|nr:hypothetical protein [Sphingomicrobium arenosum]
MMNFTADQWIIIGLVFLMGLIIGAFLLAGGGRKWKERYRAEKEHRERVEADYAAAEKEWREKDSLRAAALRDGDRRPAARDTDGDGVPNRADDRPLDPGKA